MTRPARSTSRIRCRLGAARIVVVPRPIRDRGDRTPVVQRRRAGDSDGEPLAIGGYIGVDRIDAARYRIGDARAARFRRGEGDLLLRCAGQKYSARCCSTVPAKRTVARSIPAGRGGGPASRPVLSASITSRHTATVYFRVNVTSYAAAARGLTSGTIGWLKRVVKRSITPSPIRREHGSAGGIAQSSDRRDRQHQQRETACQLRRTSPPGWRGR